MEKSTRALLACLPNTGTMGKMMAFYSIFSFSVPYVPFIPVGGIDQGRCFAGGPGSPANAARVEFRRRLRGFIEQLDPGAPLRFRWPLDAET